MFKLCKFLKDVGRWMSALAAMSAVVFVVAVFTGDRGFMLVSGGATASLFVVGNLLLIYVEHKAKSEMIRIAGKMADKLAEKKGGAA